MPSHERPWFDLERHESLTSDWKSRTKKSAKLMEAVPAGETGEALTTGGKLAFSDSLQRDDDAK